MENVETQGTARGPLSVGTQLREAREAAGKSRAEIASQTKIAERHLLSLEEDRLGDLAGKTYAVGFARTYARVVGLDERIVAAKVREQMGELGDERPEYVPSFEPGDPARVPTRRLAWVAAAGVVVAIAALLVFWSSFLSPEGKLPDLLSSEPAPAPIPKAAAPAPAPAPAAVPTGPVTLTATADRVWVKITDGTGAQVLQKELAQGEVWTAPADIAGLQLRTGRPDALRVAIGDKVLPPLSTEPKLIAGVSLAAADLLARSTPVPSGSAVPSPAATAPVAALPTPASPVSATAPARRQTPRPSARATADAASRAESTRGPTEVPTPESLLPPSLSTTSN